MNERFFNEKRSDKIDIRVEPTLKELIGDIAFTEGVSISDFVRTLLILEVERRKLLKHNQNKISRSPKVPNSITVF